MSTPELSDLPMDDEREYLEAEWHLKHDDIAGYEDKNGYDYE